jgi:hypothetical protein
VSDLMEAVGVRCACGHGAGYHDAEDGTPAVTLPHAPLKLPAGRCHHDGCECTRWVLTITEPGVYDGIPDADYHRDCVAGGSLSSTGARRLLPPGCPAQFRWDTDNPPPPKPHFDIGHAAHKLVLGTGPEVVVVDAPDWRTKVAKEARDEAHARGAVPLLVAEWQRVQAMADALRRHDIASTLFDPARGRPEVTLVWRDDKTGTMCRARFDWLPDRGPWRLIIPDYKTAHAVDLDALQRAVASYGYHQQSAWYRAGAMALGLGDEDTAFVFVCQQKHPPYLVTVVELDHVAMRLGAARNRQALDIHAHWTRAGRWPDHTDGEIAQLSLPAWVEREEGADLL